MGVGALSDTELLAMILRSGSPGLDVLDLSRQLIQEAGSLALLVGYAAEDFRNFKGVGRVKALQLVAIMELARRVVGAGPEVQPTLDEPEKVFRMMHPRTVGLDVEKFWVIALNRKNRLLRVVEVTSGTANASLVHPREVFREAIRLAASAIICVRNHPSGDPSPSRADLQVTRQLRTAAEAVQIDFLDHLIIGSPKADPAGTGFYSFSLAGLL